MANFYVFVFTFMTTSQQTGLTNQRTGLPIYNEQVGVVSRAFAAELSLFVGEALELRPNVPGAGVYGQEGPGYVLAPFASSLEQRTRIVGDLVQSLVKVEAIPQHAVRNELQV